MTAYPEHSIKVSTDTPRLKLVLSGPTQVDPGYWHGVLVDCTGFENEPGGLETAKRAKEQAERVAAEDYAAFGGYWLLTTFGKIMWIDPNE